MKRKTFLIILISLFSILFILTLAHIIYDACNFNKASVIKFISLEWWALL